MCATVDDVMHRITADTMTTHSPHPMDGPAVCPANSVLRRTMDAAFPTATIKTAIPTKGRCSDS